MAPHVSTDRYSPVAAVIEEAADFESSEQLYSWEEVAQHGSTDDAWIVIKGRIYDVTKFSRIHPGGDIILTAAGQDATDVFAAFHANTSSWRYLPTLCIGVVKGPRKTKKSDESYIADVAKMRQTMQSMRLFESSKWYYTAKTVSTTAICLLAVAILLAAPGSHLAVCLAAVTLAVFWQQCGWLAHDFLHHQVFFNRGLNNIAGLIIGNLYQGFSVNWWKSKHNHHHAVPNVTDAPSGGDPDIATMPILFWSEKLIEGEDLHRFPKWMLKNQSVLYWPILCMARISWLIQSIQHQIAPVNPYVTSMLMYISEVSILITHHALYLYLVSFIKTWPLVVMFVIISQSLGGLLIGVVFTVGHNAMEVFTEEELRATDFVNLQVRSTRDVDPHWFTDWFCGGLNYQVEHHIWPTIPRHNLPRAAVFLKQFCEKHSIPYSSAGLIEGNRQVCKLISKLSQQASTM